MRTAFHLLSLTQTGFQCLLIACLGSCGRGCRPTLRRVFRLVAMCLLLSVVSDRLSAQSPAATPTKAQELKYVVYLSRHGVRSPTTKSTQYDRYSAVPWPEWNVPPGYLTAHGYKLMTLFGAYDRARLAAEGLLSLSGCSDAQRVTILADSDQRTRETGKAVAEGMFPGCAMEVHALPEGTPDPLFHSSRAGMVDADRALAEAAIEGRIGGDLNGLTAAYRPQLEALDRVLSGCIPNSNPAHQRTSIFDVPAKADSGEGKGSGRLGGPLTIASTLSENLLLEFTEGFTGADLGWGCLDEDKLREIMQLHTAVSDFSQRTPVIARSSASYLLRHIRSSIDQAATGRPVSDALGKPGDRVLFLVGHDSNIASVAGALGLTWIIDGRRDDTPPGGALLFELWRSREDGKFSVKVSYTTQTLQQMRHAEPLLPDKPPPRVNLFVPDCSTRDESCPLEAFDAAVDERWTLSQRSSTITPSRVVHAASPLRSRIDH